MSDKMNDKDLYSAIFDIVSTNAGKAGSTMEVRKECYMYLTEASPDTVDILELSKEEDNSLFLEKAYYIMLCSMVDKKAKSDWSDYEKLPKEDFQMRVINAIKGSEEFFTKQIKLKNNIYSGNNPYGGSLIGLRGGSSVSVPEKLMRTYRKMPEFVKKAARRIMGIGG